ncbi:MAG: hypothetical protein JXA50_10175 [Deltaproteobacteria bacterium]|nr:hypothetical protein [Deltaproteobacteria bacterium]
MRLLLYVSVNEGVGKRLQKKVEDVVPKNNLEVYRTIENLSRRFRQPADNLPITAVLLAARSEDLVGFLSIRDLLRDVRIILILPDRDEDTIAQGHTLRPRFLSYTDSDFSDIVAVLKKCLASYAIKR